jgi:hypothetical protein
MRQGRAPGGQDVAEEAAAGMEIWLVPLPGELPPAELLGLFTGPGEGTGTNKAGLGVQAAPYRAGS